MSTKEKGEGPMLTNWSEGIYWQQDMHTIRCHFVDSIYANRFCILSHACHCQTIHYNVGKTPYGQPYTVVGIRQLQFSVLGPFQTV